MKMKTMGINLQKAADAKYRLLPVPSIFIVGKDGEIKFEYVNPDHTIRLHPDVCMKQLNHIEQPV